MTPTQLPPGVKLSSARGSWEAAVHIVLHVGHERRRLNAHEDRPRTNLRPRDLEELQTAAQPIKC
jgi:hypothetical protein